LKNINSGASFPGRREDFDSDAAWQHWRTQETTQLQQLMLIMAQSNPELAKSTPADILPPSPSTTRPLSIYSQFESTTLTHHASVSSRRSFFGKNEPSYDNDDFAPSPSSGDEDIPVGHHFTFIPPNPKKFYKRLVEYCLVADLELMLSPEVDDNDEVSLGILSDVHILLIDECATRWRIGDPYRVTCFLDLVKQFYERNNVPMECIPEALQNVNKVAKEAEVSLWPTQDVRLLFVHVGAKKCLYIYITYTGRLHSNCQRRPLQPLPILSLPRHGHNP
jgi:hypothetical protein